MIAKIAAGVLVMAAAGLVAPGIATAGPCQPGVHKPGTCTDTPPPPKCQPGVQKRCGS